MCFNFGYRMDTFCSSVCVASESMSLQVESPSEQELKALKLSLADTQPVQAAVECCKTMDQVGVAGVGVASISHQGRSLKFMQACGVCIISFVDCKYIAPPVYVASGRFLSTRVFCSQCDLQH